MLALAQKIFPEGSMTEGMGGSITAQTAVDDFGLVPAVYQMVEELNTEGWQIDCEETLGEERLSSEIETALYRIVQEALTNVRKHAYTTKARVALMRLSGKVRLEIRDEGHGFDPSTVSEDGGPGERVGLCSMRESIALLGGELKIKSKPGVGTSLVVEVPLPIEPEGKETEGG